MEVDRGLIDFLSSPESYREHPTTVVCHETHISLVFVGDAMVYKIKRPVDFGFLDFTTLDRRRFFCHEEVRLNRRLAPGIYLGVVPIYRTKTGYSFARRRGAECVEYAVRMRRFPEDRLLSLLVSRGKLLEGALGEVGRIVALFHGSARIHRHDPFGSIEAVRINTEENFEQIARYRGTTIEDSAYSRLVAYTREFMGSRGSLFHARKLDGFVREGHGDLHSRHVCLARPPVVVDCIEFNKRFRIGDVLEDIAFLLMDLEYSGRFDLSAALSGAYSSVMAEAIDIDLLQFYKIYRAIVRGKVEGFTADTLPDGEGQKSAAHGARNYYLLAEYYARGREGRFNPVVFAGVSGSGKSTIARALFDDARIITSDLVRKEIAGVPAGSHVYVEYGAGIYDQAMTERVYRTMTEKAVDAARRGERVIVDAAFLAASQRIRFYDECVREGLDPFFVFCFAGESTLRKRVARRMAEGEDPSDAHVAVLERQLREVEEPAELPSFRVMRLDTTEETPGTIQRSLRQFLWQ
jgi:aminoglycoside phosphotransferase family enzyme/predicted kinase